MPWSPKQMKLFQAAAHSPKLAEKAAQKAKKMASEGVLTPQKRIIAIKHLRGVV